jgi:tetratricopeptide (TPR) repeat protein
MAQTGDDPKPSADPESSTRAAVLKTAFVFKGKIWTITYKGSRFSLRNNLGLGYIHRLLQQPGQEFRALDLLMGPPHGALTYEGNSVAAHFCNSENGALLTAGDAGPVLDTQAKQQYRRVIAQLREELDELHQRGDQERGATIERDLEFVTRELIHAVKLGGRDRHAGSVAERARLNVTRAIRAAIQRISEHHSELGQLLGNDIRTGGFCSYVPNPKVPITWHFEEKTDSAPQSVASAPTTWEIGNSLGPAQPSRIAFVGREVEQAILRRGLEQAQAGNGQIMIICGPPGIGKTRTAREAGEQARGEGFVVLGGNCYDRADTVPFIPFVELFEAALEALSPSAIREFLGQQANEVARLLPQLRRLLPDLPQPLDLPPQESRRLLFNAIVELLARQAALSPMLLLFEDVHWADEATLALLVRVAQAISRMRCLIIVTHRDDEIDLKPPLTKTLDELIRLRVVERIRLLGLPAAAVAQMIEALSGKEPSRALVDHVYSSTDGNPLFVEEIVQHLEQSGSNIESLEEGELALPASLRVVIGRRLGLVSKDTRKILETAATIGRSFTFALLESATGVQVEKLIDCVEEAENAGLIWSKLEHPDARFQFAHELMRRSAMEEVSAARSQQLHLRIAQAIELLYPNALEDRADDLAHHFWNAGRAADPAKTIHFLQLAGKKAVLSSAINEALNHFRRALEMLSSLRPTEDNIQQELSLQLRVGSALGTVRGWSAPEVGQAFGRATELCRKIGTRQQLFSAISGMANFHALRSELHQARELTQELTALAEHGAEDHDLVGAHQVSGTVLWVMGAFSEARRHLERAISIADRLHTLFLASGSSDDPGVLNRAYATVVLCCLGFPDQALKLRRQAVELIRKLAHPYSLAAGFGYLAYFHLLRREGEAVLELVDEAGRIAAEYGFQRAAKDLAGLRGFALIEMNRPAEGIFQSQQSGASLRGHGSGWLRAAGLARLGWAYGRLGRPADGLAALAKGLEVSARTGERWFDAELHRLKGELLLQAHGGVVSSVAAEAQACFRQALGIARSQHAKWWELRAATSLAGLLARQNELDAARQALLPVYTWFTEGFDTPDLKESKALLDELS